MVYLVTEGSYEMGNFAVDHGMTVNFFPLARTDMEAVAGNVEHI